MVRLEEASVEVRNREWAGLLSIRIDNRARTCSIIYGIRHISNNSADSCQRIKFKVQPIAPSLRRLLKYGRPSIANLKESFD